ncbi:UNVERIFIED_CONTAM: hypothetical protein HHA_221530 [Hammondia hammondi]|eukprot:XP_008886272.1 hypothetical protein HHA_221530 [Hammondia hammondi]
MGNQPGGVAGTFALVSPSGFVASQTELGGKRETVVRGSEAFLGGCAGDGRKEEVLLALGRTQFYHLVQQLDLEPRLLRTLEALKAKERGETRKTNGTGAPGGASAKPPCAHIVVKSVKGKAPCPICDKRKVEAMLLKQDTELFRREFANLEALLPVDSSLKIRDLYSNFQTFTSAVSTHRTPWGGALEAGLSSPYPRREPREKDPQCSTCTATEEECALAHADACRACYKLEGLCTFVDIHRHSLEQAFEKPTQCEDESKVEVDFLRQQLRIVAHSTDVRTKASSALTGRLSPPSRQRFRGCADATSYTTSPTQKASGSLSTRLNTCVAHAAQGIRQRGSRVTASSSLPKAYRPSPAETCAGLQVFSAPCPVLRTTSCASSLSRSAAVGRPVRQNSAIRSLTHSSAFQHASGNQHSSLCVSVSPVPSVPKARSQVLLVEPAKCLRTQFSSL